MVALMGAGDASEKLAQRKLIYEAFLQVMRQYYGPSAPIRWDNHKVTGRTHFEERYLPFDAPI